jgi:hypothetical protein
MMDSSFDLYQLLAALKAFKNGDFSVRLPTGQPGVAAEVAETFNEMAAQTSAFAMELTRLAQELGPVGRMGGQIWLDGLSGTWKDLQDEMNRTGVVQTCYLRDMWKVMTSLVNGEPADFMTFDVNGEMSDVKDLVNQLVQKIGTPEASN